MLLSPSFGVESSQQGVHTAKIRGKVLGPKNLFFGLSVVFSQYSVGHSFIRWGWFLDILWAIVRAIKHPSFMSVPFLLLPVTGQKVVDFSVFCSNLAGNLDPSIRDRFYQIPSEKRRFSYIPTFRHFVRLSVFCYRNSNAIIIIACGHEKIIYSKWYHMVAVMLFGHQMKSLN